MTALHRCKSTAPEVPWKRADFDGEIRGLCGVGAVATVRVDPGVVVVAYEVRDPERGSVSTLSHTRQRRPGVYEVEEAVSEVRRRVRAAGWPWPDQGAYLAEKYGS